MKRKRSKMIWFWKKKPTLPNTFLKTLCYIKNDNFSNTVVIINWPSVMACTLNQTQVDTCHDPKTITWRNWKDNFDGDTRGARCVLALKNYVFSCRIINTNVLFRNFNFVLGRIWAFLAFSSVCKYFDDVVSCKILHSNPKIGEWIKIVLNICFWIFRDKNRNQELIRVYIYESKIIIDHEILGIMIKLDKKKLKITSKRNSFLEQFHGHFTNKEIEW